MKSNKADVQFICFFLFWQTTAHTVTHLLPACTSIHKLTQRMCELSIKWCGCCSMGLNGFYSKVSVWISSFCICIFCARWQSGTNFNKTETAIQLPTTVHASDFIFNLGVTAATWPSGDRQLASLASAQVPSQPHLPEADWEALFPFVCETRGAPGRAVTQCDSFPSAKIGQPRPKLKMSAKTNSISKGPCVLPSLCSLVSSAKCCVSSLRRTPLNPTRV